MAHTRKQLNSWCKGLVDVVYGPEAHSSWYQPYCEYEVEFTHRSIYDFLESNTTMMATNWQPFLRGFDAGDALSQITWATHKPTLTRCPWLFPDRELIIMRWRNGLDKAPFEYLERLAHDDGDGIRMIYEVGKFDDHTIGTISLRYHMYSYSTVASRRFQAFEEPDICINLANATTCVFGILFHAVLEGHTEYLKWKIENDLSSINNADNAVLLICTFLESTVSLQLSHPTASAAILTLLFENNLASPESMSFWAPGHLSVHPFSTTPELANVKLSVWHWYLFRVTSGFIAPLLEWGLLPAPAPMPPSTCARFMYRLSAQHRAQIGKVLETFLEHGADPYFLLSVRPEKTVQGVDTVYRFQLEFEFGRERARILIMTAGWTTKKPTFFGRFPLKKGLKLTFRQWVENLELPNFGHVISHLERNERRQEAKLAHESEKERIGYDTATSATSASEGSKPSGVGAMDEPVEPNKGGTVTRRAGIGGLCAQISLLALGMYVISLESDPHNAYPHNRYIDRSRCSISRGKGFDIEIGAGAVQRETKRNDQRLA